MVQAPNYHENKKWAQRSWQDLAYLIQRASKILSNYGEKPVVLHVFIESWLICRSSQVCKDMIAVLYLLVAHGRCNAT